VAQAYDDHCKKVLKAKEAQKGQRVYDEFTTMVCGVLQSPGNYN